MEYNIRVGMKAEIEIVVGEEHTAQSFGSGGVRVLATPMMIALMEKAALMAVDPFLGEGNATVGTVVNAAHLAATPVGMKARAIAELTEINGKKLSFKIEAYDAVEKIGEGSHDRYIINVERFLAKTEKKNMG